jgi:hypothetical protein
LKGGENATGLEESNVEFEIDIGVSKMRQLAKKISLVVDSIAATHVANRGYMYKRQDGFSLSRMERIKHAKLAPVAEIEVCEPGGCQESPGHRLGS